jgi:putative flippase GtrA
VRLLLTRLARFGTVGVTITGFNYLLYAFLITQNVHYLVATTVGWVVGVCAAFFGNKYFTFLHFKAVDKGQIRKFLSCYVSQLLIGTTTMVLMIDTIGMGYHMAFFINVAITSSYSFLFMDRLVFLREKRPISS